jgi:hypothetical protein
MLVIHRRFLMDILKLSSVHLVLFVVLGKELFGFS